MINFNKYSKESCYFAGVIAGDGWITYPNKLSYKIATKDKLFFELVSKAFGFTWTRIRTSENPFPVYERTGRKFESIEGIVRNKDLISNLDILWNIGQNKTYTYQPPIKMSEEYIPHFIRGLLDSDGTVYWRKPSGHCKGGTIAYQFLGTKEVCQWVADCIRKYVHPKFKGNPGQSKRDQGCWRLYIASKSTAKLLTNWFYENSDSNIRLERKYTKAKEYTGKTVIYPHVNPPNSRKYQGFTA